MAQVKRPEIYEFWPRKDFNDDLNYKGVVVEILVVESSNYRSKTFLESISLEEICSQMWS